MIGSQTGSRTAPPVRRLLWRDVSASRCASLVRFDEPVHVVDLAGALDLASREATVRDCTLPGQLHVVAAMAKVTFMDCAGYGALLASYVALRERGGSLSLLDATGEPLRLLLLIEQLAGEASPLLRNSSSPPPPVFAQETRAITRMRWRRGASWNKKWRGIQHSFLRGSV